jgi:hypothetical protein
MDAGQVLIGGLLVVGAAAGLYGLHRLGLWLEERGWLYYRHRSPTSTMAGCFVALQQALEPPTRYVIVARETRRHTAEEPPGKDVAEPGRETDPGR